MSRLVAIGRDVTEEQRLQERVIQSERLAMVGRMAAQVAHEIRNPLSAIGLNIELLTDLIDELPEADRDEAKELIRITMSGIERLNGVIGDYLRFARMPVKQLQEEAVNDMMEELIHLIRSEMHPAHVDLSVRLDGNLPSVKADRMLIGQQVLNCVRNALEAMPDGGVLTLATDIEENEVRISISDTGDGISPEHVERVFDPFFSTKENGTGLGLPYVQQIMQEHGGRLDLNSVPGAGTTVTLLFPASTPEVS
ncbi:MAG: hypothetical protein FJY97_01940 [candidate division Zixibacteria bacterium]|nr:hypothetical protein [candidate division Zixibacteria bacterium]